MRHEVEARLALKGQAQVHQLENQLTCLKETMLRISGAIQVLEELLSSSASHTSAEETQELNRVQAVS